MDIQAHFYAEIPKFSESIDHITQQSSMKRVTEDKQYFCFPNQWLNLFNKSKGPEQELDKPKGGKITKEDSINSI